MLPSAMRLQKESIRLLMEKGQSFHSPFLISRLISNSSSKRFSILVSKKVAKTAVLRNKIRRRVYSIISRIESRTLGNFDIVLIAKKEIEKLSFLDLSSEIEKIFVKSGVLK